jgi:DNA (cytosine-5)-methyltransferase 1
MAVKNGCWSAGHPVRHIHLSVARMRSTHPDFENDERHFLYREYLRIIADHRPPVFVMENVKRMLSAQHSGQKIIGRILSDLRKPDMAVNGRNTGLGYRLFSLADARSPEKCEPEDFLVKAEKYDIPQTRHRVLILGIRAHYIGYTHCYWLAGLGNCRT